MLFADLKDVPIDVFGGYVPAIPPQDLPPGASPLAQDCIFPMNAVRQRGGLSNLNYAGIPGTAQINGIKSFVTPTLDKRMLAWDSFGNFYKESPQGTLNLIASRNYTNLFYQAVTIFGRQYQSFFNATTGGFDIPRQYDDTNWDRVTMGGPGSAPNAADEIATNLTIQAGPTGATQLNAFNILSLSSNGFLCTMSFTVFIGGVPVAGFTPKVGDRFQIAGASIAGYNGTWTVAGIVGLGSANLSIQFINTVAGLGTVSASGAVSWAYAQLLFTANMTANANVGTGNLVVVAGVGLPAYVGSFRCVFSSFTAGLAVPNFIFVNINAFGTAASGAGTASIAGNVTAGLHQLSVCWVTRQGWISIPATPNSWISGGSKRVTVSGIPIYQNDAQGQNGRVVSRLLIFTSVITAPATTGSFFSLPNGSSQVATSMMLITDNVTTSVTLDFNDIVLQAGFQANFLFNQIIQGEPTFIGGYNNRLVTLADRNKVPNFINMDFEGGWAPNSVPLGWTPGASFLGVIPAVTSDYGAALSIQGDGVTAVRGLITQTAYRDFLNVPIISSNTSYSVRVRLRRDGFATASAFNIALQSTIAGVQSLFTVQNNDVNMSNNFFEFSGILLPATTFTSSIPTDLQLQVFVNGTPSNGSGFRIDSIEVFPTLAPYNYSTARFSHAFNPESFDSVTSSVQVRPSDGQRLQAGFPIRSNFYLAKDNYLSYVNDDGVNEPAQWGGGVVEVSSTIGICGPNAVDYTEEWAAFAHRSGFYVCWGSDPVKISQEIQEDASGTGKPTWNSINWNAAATIWVRIDQINKRILIGAPINGAVTPNIIFVLDYKWLDSAQDIASSPMVTYSAFTGKSLAHGRGRRWATWTITANSMGFIERTDGTAQPFFGNGTGNGKIYQQVEAPTQISDDGVFIPFRYDTYFAPSIDLEQALQLGAHRKLLGTIKWLAKGSGGLTISIVSPARTTPLRQYVLSLTPPGDSSRPTGVHGERFSLSFATSALPAGGFAWTQLEKTTLCLKKDPTIVIRGTNQ